MYLFKQKIQLKNLEEMTWREWMQLSWYFKCHQTHLIVLLLPLLLLVEWRVWLATVVNLRHPHKAKAWIHEHLLPKLYQVVAS